MVCACITCVFSTKTKSCSLPRCKGVTKTYKLTYESVEVMHAVFDKNAANNAWSISGSLLKSWAEHFGATEQLDMYSENGRVVFTSYTEKIMDGKGMC